MTVCECHIAASLSFSCIAAVDVVDLLGNVRELKCIAYSIAIICIACVQIVGVRCPPGKDYRVG